MQKKNLFLWSLYDFANSIVYIAFLLYFAQWLVVDAGLPDFWYNALFAIATLMLLFSAPLLAARVDKQGGGKFWLTLATLGTAAFYALAVLTAYQGTPYVWAAALLFLLGQYCYQLSFVFYTPMLVQIAPEGKRARASGIGQFANALGQIAGVVIALPFASTHLGPMLPAVGIFLVLALPMLLFYKESPAAPTTTPHEPYFKKLSAFIFTSAAASFVVAYFFFNDAVITLSNNYAIVLQRMFEVPDTTKSLLLLAILISSAVGGVIAGWVADKTSVYKTLIALILGWVVMLPILASAQTFVIFSGYTVIIGLLIGSSYSTSRVYLTQLLRPEEMTYGFSLFTLFERFASFVGPLAWGSTIALVGNSSDGYRAAILSMTALMIIGLFILLKFKDGWKNPLKIS